MLKCKKLSEDEFRITFYIPVSKYRMNFKMCSENQKVEDCLQIKTKKERERGDNRRGV